MRFFTSLAVLSLAAVGLASPVDTDAAIDARHSPCLNSGDIDKLVDAYKRIISNWNDADAKYLADNFRDTSDSINILAGIPLGSDTFPNKAAFLNHMQTNVRPPSLFNHPQSMKPTNSKTSPTTSPSRSRTRRPTAAARSPSSGRQPLARRKSRSAA